MGCFIHKWDGCVCSKCGKKRMTGHHYMWQPTTRYEKNIVNGVRHPDKKIEGCRPVCTKCGAANNAAFHEHTMIIDHCTPVCTRCGYKKLPGHKYQDVEGKCIRRCSVCGEETEIPHRMNGRIRDGRCEQVCSRCGFILSSHMWNVVDYLAPPHGRWTRGEGCTCKTCGAFNPEGHHKWEKIREGDFADIKICKLCGARDESEKITLQEAARRDYERDQAMIRADQLSEMRSVGIKC